MMTRVSNGGKVVRHNEGAEKRQLKSGFAFGWLVFSGRLEGQWQLLFGGAAGLGGFLEYGVEQGKGFGLENALRRIAVTGGC